MTSGSNSIYVTAQRNTRALEKHSVDQIARLDAALSAVGESALSLKETVTSIAGTVGAAVHAVAGDETLKNLYAGYAYQYDQIAADRSLIVIAEAAGQGAQTAGFRTSIDEEKKAAEAIDGLIESVTKIYLSRETSGKKADS